MVASFALYEIESEMADMEFDKRIARAALSQLIDVISDTLRLAERGCTLPTGDIKKAIEKAKTELNRSA